VTTALLATVAALVYGLSPDGQEAQSALTRFASIAHKEVAASTDPTQRLLVLSTLAHTYYIQGDFAAYWRVTDVMSSELGSAAGYSSAVHDHLKHGRVAQALELASKRERPLQRDVVLSWIVNYLVENDNLKEAKRVVAMIQTPSISTVATDRLLVVQCARGEMRTAELLTQAGSDQDRRGKQMFELIKYQVRQGRTDEADQALSRIESRWWRVEAASAIAMYRAKVRQGGALTAQFDELERMIRDLEPEQQVWGYLKIANDQARGGFLERADLNYQRAYAREGSVSIPMRSAFLVQCVNVLLALNRTDEAKTLAREEPTGSALYAVGQLLATREHFDAIDDLGQSISQADLRACVYAGAVAGIIESGVNYRTPSNLQR
jgi:hypothetical protein